MDSPSGNPTWDEEPLKTAPVSRRQFLEASLLGGVLGGLLPLASRASIPLAAPENTQLELTVAGNEREGYSITLVFRGQPIASHNGGAEFSAIFQNGERSLEDRIENWRANSWKGDRKQLTLQGTCHLKNAKTSVFAEVEYKVLNANVVRKKIRLHQSDMFLLYHQISNRLEPAAPPAKFWSFDQTECRGGTLRENFPAGGFRTKQNVCVGLLTD